MIVKDCLLSKSEEKTSDEAEQQSVKKEPAEEERNKADEVQQQQQQLQRLAAVDPEIPEAFQYQAVCRTIEVILSQAEVLPKLYSKLWKKLFSGNLVKLAQHEVANYTIQKLLNTCPNKELVNMPRKKEEKGLVRVQFPYFFYFSLKNTTNRSWTAGLKTSLLPGIQVSS